MATGDISARIETTTLNLTGTVGNKPGIQLFKVASGVYILFYHAGITLRCATFGVNDTTGNINGSIIEDIEAIASQINDQQQTVGQVAGTCYITTNSAGGTSLGQVTITCDTDGTNLAVAASFTESHGGVTASGLFMELDPNVVVFINPGSSADISTYEISDDGTINHTPIQSQAAITACTAFTWLRSSNTLVTVDFSSTVRTYEMNADGTFSATVVDSAALSAGNTSPSSMVVVDDANGVIAIASHNHKIGNDETNVNRVIINNDREITSVTEYFNNDRPDINYYRPTVFPISSAADSQQVFLWVEEGTASLTSIDSDLNTIETFGGFFSASTKGVYFALVSPTIGIVAHNSTLSGSEISITTFGLTSSVLTTSPSVASPTIGLLEIDNYVPRFGGTSVNLSFLLKISRWQETIDTRASILPTAQFESAALSLNIINMVIDISGVVYGTHPEHPTSAGVEHVPDFIDFEEAAILWNKNAPVTRARLKLPLVSGFRTYEGVITRLSLIQYVGTTRYDFKMTFTVAWSPTTPALREWN